MSLLYRLRPWIFTLLMAGPLPAALAQNAGVGIGTTAPDARAALEIAASDKGLLIPRLDSAQRAQIPAPPQGLLVYQTNGRAGLWYFQNGWQFLKPGNQADNLGNHTATQNLNLGTNLLVGSAAVNVGQTMSLNDNDLQLRGFNANDGNHGLGWYGTGKPWNGLNVDGPVLFGFSGGVLGTNTGGTRTTALFWGNNGRVGIGNANPQALLDVSGTTRTTGLQVTTGAATGRVLTSDAAGNASWQVPASTALTNVSAPLTGNGVSTPLAMPAASGGQNGFLSSTDWNTFNAKFNLPALTSGSLTFSNGSTLAQNNTNLFWDNTNLRLGVGTNTPSAALDVTGAVRLRTLTGVGNRMVTTDANGNLATSALPTDAQNLTLSGQSLTITTGTGVTLPVVGATNGLTATTGNVGLGGTLTQATTVSTTSFNSLTVNGPGTANLGTGTGNTALGNTTGTTSISGSTTSITSPTTGISGSVGVGTATPHASAQLEVASTTKGFLPPRMTQTQRDAIIAPATGLTIYNTTTTRLNIWNGTSWTDAVNAPLPLSAVTFNFTGAVQTYTVPTGVTSLQVDAAGAQGGSINTSLLSVQGGKGARVTTTLAVTPGEVLNIYVGGGGTSVFSNPNPGAPGGWNGGGAVTASNVGGSGGGASDIRRGGTALSNRVLVAGGGGGVGYFNTGNGGSGGAPFGAAGVGSGGGSGGTQAVGGTTGGSLGQGGANNWNSSGGGGGGYYGGGGGGLQTGNFGSGGGGSSWVDQSVASGTVMQSGTQSGNGVVTITPVHTATSSSVNGASVQFPQLSQTQINALVAPTAGMLVFNTSTGRLNFYTGSGWIEFFSTTENPSQSTENRIYYFTGGVQTYTVPAGITALDIDARGAQGGSNGSIRAGGNGARVQARLSVTPGQVLNLYVGGAGSPAGFAPGGGGYNGGGAGGYVISGGRGGGGGGATDIRIGGTALTHRVLVAGGGGGGGGFLSNLGTTGGDGGVGGAPNGGNGVASGGTTAGTGATQLAGGNQGGALGQGGNATANAQGGGGGGGYYGGGGSPLAAGGGGGSSWVTPTGSSNLTYTAGAQSGDGLITITPVGSAAAPTISASNLTGTVPVTTLGLTPQNGGIVFTDAASLRQESANLFWDNTTDRLGLGTSAPGARLTLAGNETTTNGASAGLQLQNTAATVANTWYLRAGGNGTTTPDGGLSIADNTAYRLSITNAGNVGIATTSPGTTLDVDGGLTVRPSTAVSLTLATTAITVGNRSYIQVSSNNATAGNRLITLSNGLQVGQMLIIECIANACQINDGQANVNLGGNRALGTDDNLNLIWNGSRWIEVGFNNN